MATESTPGTRIRMRRQQLRLTQKELADIIGVNPSSVISWEKDEHFPLRYQGALEAELGIRLTGDPGFEPLPPEFRRLVERRLPDPEDQRRVIGMMEGTVTWPGGDDSRPERDQDESRPQAGL